MPEFNFIEFVIEFVQTLVSVPAVVAAFAASVPGLILAISASVCFAFMAIIIKLLSGG